MMQFTIHNYQFTINNVQCLMFNFYVFLFRTMAMYHSYNAHVPFVHCPCTK